ncbi:unnamed protein product [Moneuplotes crassus]|uniref:AB hydrolase-1 domain-containing protein n=1 Tax=Euplotes crassus TaxID=5936 RepID=A0AAD2CZY2_EUPCR|nr:unnamed protein product [Moneuplotes crassus]
MLNLVAKKRFTSLFPTGVRSFSSTQNEVQLFGHKVASLNENSDKHIIFLHALLCQSRHWRSFALNDVFSRRAHCHLVDLRNHGESDQNSDMSYSAMAEDVLRYADRAEIDTFDVLGHAMGGKLGMIMANLYPNRVNSIISLDALPFDHNKTDSNILKSNIKVLDQLLSLDIEGKTRKSVIDMLNNEFSDKGVATLVSMNIIYDGEQSNTVKWCTNIKAIRNNIEKIIGYEDHGLSDKPFLGIYGDASKMLINKIATNPDSKITKDHFGYSSKEMIVEIENGGHWLHLERQTEVTKHIGLFYSEIDNQE